MRSGVQAENPHARARATSLVLSGCAVLAALQQSLVVPVISDAAELYGVGRDDATWLVTANLLAGAVCTPVVGR